MNKVNMKSPYSLYQREEKIFSPLFDKGGRGRIRNGMIDEE
jgi:hypothetical protein